MPTVNISENVLTLNEDDGSMLTINRYDYPVEYFEARNAALMADWDRVREIILEADWSDINDDEDDDDDEGPSRISCDDAIDMVKDMLDSGILSPESLGLIDKPDVGEHDLSRWSGSPIYFDSEEAAREQADRWPMFWEFHDFGAGETTPLPPKYRYAVVPKLGLAPTAPDGYDWVCLKRS